MFNPCFSNLLVEARVEELHRAAGNGPSKGRRFGTERRSAARALATVLTRTATWGRRS
jgi:hypothetical protein